MHLARGQLLVGRFALSRLLGAGGMGEVWLAEDLALVRPTALKIVAHAQPALADALRREHRRIRALDHPNIVRVYDLFEIEGGSVLSMEYLAGATLDAFLRRPAGAIVAALLPVVAALEHAHARGIVHRDLKTSNVIHGADGRPRLTDFGVASAQSRAEASEAGAFAGGSRKSMSPQQLDGEPARPADDVHGLGALLYELIAGTPPLGADPLDEAIRERVPVPLGRLAPQIPAALGALVDAMLAKDPAQRPADMAALLRALAPHATASPALPAAWGESEPSGAARALELEPIPVRARSAAAARGSLRRRLRTAAARGNSRRRLQLAAAAGALLVLGGAGAALAPRWLAHPPQSAGDEPGSGSPIAQAARAPSPDRPDPARAERPEVSRADLDPTLARTLERQEQLEAMAADAWAPDAWRAIRERIAGGDRQLSAQAWAQAQGEYSAAITDMEALLERAPEELARQLALGAQALDGADPEAALRAFDLAVKIAPDNPRAQQGVRRAGRLGEVLQKVGEGGELEQKGELEGARAAYAAAAELDPEWAPASSALARVRAVLDRRAYEARLTQAFGQLAAGDYRAAREAFRAALALVPDSAQARAGLAEVEQVSGTRAIEAERDRARELEKAERWSEAAASYRKILKIDAQLAFAAEALERCERRAALDAQLRAALGSSAQLAEEPELLQRAQSALSAAQSTPDPGPELRRQQQQLAAAIAAATTPVAVVLESDAQTEVSVVPLGALGRFARRELELRPGTYTVVGSRDGYRDVRAELIVQPGTPPPPLQIRVEERIR